MLLITAPFWRNEPLSDKEQKLLGLLFEAHDKAAVRPNPSMAAVSNAGCASGDYTKAIASALLTLGGLHAPLIQTVELLTSQEPAKLATAILDAGGKVPGWGSSFAKGKPDPDWFLMWELLRKNHREVWDVLHAITAAIHDKGKTIFPNPSAYTAATAIVLGIPAPFAPYLLVAARLDAWSKLLMSHA